MAALYAYRLVASPALTAGGGPEDGDRDGGTYVPGEDSARLNRQQRRVFDVIKDGKWWTLAEIAAMTGASEASVSARLRDFRKERFGGSTVERAAVYRYE